LKNRKEYHLIEEGDILVISMTTPDAVPVMEKCKAIVTDEGGVLCHASIISRELNKPCIVGTDIATKAINTGDRIIVDANKGIVRRL
jgi:pyruvate,water dikinase